MATVASRLAPGPQTSDLPGHLLKFFAKYPPQNCSAFTTKQRLPTLKERKVAGAKPLSSTQAYTAPITEEISAKSLTASPKSEQESSAPETAILPNPFLPYKNPATGRWRGARYGLMKQAQLFKSARQFGIEDLLPPSVKSSEYKQRRALERGLQVRGTGEGQQVKGHKWERTKEATLEKRRKAMEEMPEMIRLWKQRGHGRGWKKYPK